MPSSEGPLVPADGQPMRPRAKTNRPNGGVAGDDDPLIPLINARIMHRLIAGSQLHIYGGGHVDLIAQPHRLAPVIERFLGTGQAPAAPPGKART